MAIKHEVYSFINSSNQNVRFKIKYTFTSIFRATVPYATYIHVCVPLSLNVFFFFAKIPNKNWVYVTYNKSKEGRKPDRRLALDPLTYTKRLSDSQEKERGGEQNQKKRTRVNRIEKKISKIMRTILCTE